MSVDSKMTAIADLIRELLNLSGKMGLDDMAENLKIEKGNVANAYTAIEAKGGTIPSNKLSENLAAAINSIPDAPEGITVQSKTGSATINGTDSLVDLGFKPDAVFFTGTNVHDNTKAHAGVEFKEANITSMDTYFVGPSMGYILSIFTVTQDQTGFKVKGVKMDTSAKKTNESNRVVNYIAVKYS